MSPRRDPLPAVTPLRFPAAFVVFVVHCWMLLKGADPLTFSELHRHFRKMNVVYGPEGNPLFFRYYDPRVLPSVLEVMEPDQLSTFFGPVERFALQDVEGRLHELRMHGGTLLVDGQSPAA